MGARMRVVGLIVGGLVLLSSGGAAAGSPAPLLERPSCRSSAPGKQAAGPGSIVVRLTVPAVVRLQLDSSGAVAAAATNTGCAPKGDEAFVVDGVRAATAAEVAAAVATFGSAGDWTEPGRWVPAP